jgi:hypothetical protein
VAVCGGCLPESLFAAQARIEIQVPKLRFRCARGHRWEGRKGEREKERIGGDELTRETAA